MMHAISMMLGALMAGVVLFRVISVLDHMTPGARGISYLRFLGFGLSYVFLAVACVIAEIGVIEQQADPSDWLFLGASAGLIVFDRRRRRNCESEPCDRVTIIRGAS